MKERNLTVKMSHAEYEINEKYDEENNKIIFSGEIKLDNSKEALRVKYLPKVNGTPTIVELLREIKTERDEMLEKESYAEVMDKYGVDLY